MRASRFVVVALFALAACRDTGRAPTAQGGGGPGGTIVISAPEPDILFPPMVQTASGRAITDLVYERLAEIGPEMNTIGDRGFEARLAERWEWAPDSLSIAFHLDPRAKWHDGRPVRAADVRESVLLHKNPEVAPGVAPLLGNVDSVSVRDSLTAVAWFHRRSPEEFYDLVYNVVILPSHLLAGIAPSALKDAPIARAPVGTGRFRFVRWDAGTRVELIADTAHYRRRAMLDRVIWTPMTDFNAGFTQLLAGQSDFIEIIPPALIGKIDSSANAHAVPYPGFQYTFMGMNLHAPKSPNRPHPLFGDARMRRALSMAVDRRALLTNVFGSLGKLGYGPFPASHSTADTTLKVPPYDVTAAGALLDSLGWKLGPDSLRHRNGQPLAFRLLVPTTSAPRMRYAVLLQAQFRRVGARVDIESLEFNTFFGRQQARDFDAILAAYSTDPSPAGARQTWATAGIGPDGSNFLGYSNRRFDTLLDSALASFDPAKTRAYMRQAYQVVADDAPAIWLYDVLTVAGAHRRIDIVGLRPDGWWNGLADWTIAPAKRIDRDRVGLSSGGR